MRKVFFIRHVWSESSKPSEHLHRKGLLGIHFQDEPRSVDPDDYKGHAKRILTALRDMDADDLICSYFPTDKFIEVGPIDKKFGIRLEDCELEHGKRWVLKVARHEKSKTKRLPFSHFPMLLAAMPRQGTFGQWHVMENQIHSIYERGTVERDYTALKPAQIEALCTSYLFGTGRLKVLSMPTGRTMKDIDIAGFNPQGERILVQITFSDDKSVVREKAAALEGYSKDAPHLMFIAPEKMKDEVQDQEFISLETVWEYWASQSGGIFLDAFCGQSAAS